MMEIDIGKEVVTMNSDCATCIHMIDEYCHDTGIAPPVKYCADMHNISVLWQAVGRRCGGWNESEEVEYGLVEGDKLIVTNECAKNIGRRGWPAFQLDGWREGDTLTFKGIRLDSNTCTLMSGSKSSGGFPIAMVQKMRVAYIESI